MEYVKNMYYEEESMKNDDLIIDEITLAINGDKTAFINLIEKYKLDMYKIGRGLLSCDEDVGDAMQETVVKAFKNIGKLKNRNSFKGWLLKIMVNECHNILKSKGKYIVTEEAIVNASYTDEYKVETEHVRKAIKSLDEEFRDVVILYYYNDLNINDISNTLDIPEGTVKSRLSRARKKLFNLLREER
ncbi:RNA polymerase sigma-70 factor, ECF subfamily [Clostridium cavendishii DSM 21758]|uniref:RNA polymerase sigma-70 factor, ECF subfamily n=1 Tax=Clostridium cavendishii DSM 21758 TaxID=1121302 RepID=A0A1M6TG85_9CLOT|nr:RNA polymerase sigma factor [Clostridium cavendishii]SHK55995.1 RNA polymerase sigma-70 factor, ECF subfamily [Clostridium cavendishii DSM 21758]